jgi:hypothetical protein
MKPTTGSVLALAALALSFATPTAWAQSVRVVGTIGAVDGRTLVVKTDKGEVKVNLAEKVAIFAVEKLAVEDIKTGDFIGVGAMPQADGSQRAVQINIFAESQRGLGEGRRPWSRDPKGTMTNATVDTTVGSVDGRILMVKYKEGEKKIIVTPEASIQRYAKADADELKPGAAVVISNVEQKPGGALEASRVNVGRSGHIPR